MHWLPEGFGGWGSIGHYSDDLVNLFEMQSVTFITSLPDSRPIFHDSSIFYKPIDNQ